jgi:hypothetical protein
MSQEHKLAWLAQSTPPLCSIIIIIIITMQQEQAAHQSAIILPHTTWQQDRAIRLPTLTKQHHHHHPLALGTLQIIRTAGSGRQTVNFTRQFATWIWYNKGGQKAPRAYRRSP